VSAVELTREELELVLWALGYVEGALGSDEWPSTQRAVQQARDLAEKLKGGN
jgi:hypothetical protein